MTLKRRVGDLARRAIGRSVMEGNFDGLDGLSLTGWLREGNGGAVTLVYGDATVALGRANVARPDLAAAGVQGAGFTFPVDALIQSVESAVENGEIEPRVLKVTTLSGNALTRTTVPISPTDLMGLLALSIAVRVMGAPTSGDAVDIY